MVTRFLTPQSLVELKDLEAAYKEKGDEWSSQGLRSIWALL